MLIHPARGQDAPLVHSVSYGVQGNLTQIGCKVRYPLPAARVEQPF